MYYLMNKNEKIAKTAFEGGLHGRHLSTTSPEYGTDGSFAKCWIRLPYAVEPDEFTYGGTYYREHGPRIGDNWVNIAVACKK